MITYVVGNLFQSPAKVLVNTVNTVGVMGKGIAKEFKQIYPEMFSQYQKLCENGSLKVGNLWLYKTPHKWILNFPTKQEWRKPSKIEYIEAGLEKFVNNYSEKGITSIAFPRLGCGNGELDWKKDVKPMMVHYLRDLPIEIFIYLYRDDLKLPEHHEPNRIKDWLRSEPESLSFNEVWDDILLIINKSKNLTKLFSSESFLVNLSNKGDEAIEIIENKKPPILIYKADLLALWQHLRSFGFCMDRTMPNGLEKYLPYIIAIFSKLDYIKPVFLAKEEHFLNNNSIGLQLLPRSQAGEKALSSDYLKIA